MSYPSYVCISHAAEDVAFAEDLLRELSDYGFRCQRMDEHTSAEDRQIELDGCALLVVITSPAASRVETCMEDLCAMMARGRSALCVQLEESDMEARLFTEARLAAEDFVAWPAEDAHTPEGQAWLCHHLFVRHMCRHATCFSEVRCVDTPRGECIRRAVKAWDGHSRSQYLLSLTYARGGVLPVMPAEARCWMEKAAAGGDTDAMIDVGYLMLRGVGGQADPDEACGLFLRAAQLGHPRGYEAYGLCCLHGYGVERNVSEAVRAFEVALHDGYAPAGYRLGLMYRDGDGIAADAIKAMNYLYAACEEGGRYPLYGYRLTPAKRGGRRFRCVPLRQIRPRLGDLLFGKDGRWRDDPRLRHRVKHCMAVNRFRADGYPEDGWLDNLELPTEDALREASAIRRRMTWDVSMAEDALGALLEKGQPTQGIRPAPHAALVHYRRAAKSGNSDAMFRLGEAYLKGSGCPVNVTQAARLFRRCAAWGNERGLFALGVCYERGLGVPYDPVQALNRYGQAAAMGYAPAQNNLGGCYERGVGVAQDFEAAVEWYRRAADGGEPHALCRLGMCYENGKGVVRDKKQAVALYEQSAKLEFPYAVYRLGLCHHKGCGVETDLPAAVHLYERAARMGVADAAYVLALCHRFGWGVVCDRRTAFLWFAEAAKRGHVQAAYEAGLCFLEGRAAVQSDTRAVEMFRRAVSLYASWDEAVRGDLDEALPEGGLTAREAAGMARYMLGYCTMYERGIQHPAPLQQAIEDFEQAAGMGNSTAMVALGDIYTYRIADADRAQQAYEDAAAGGNTEALLTLAGYDRAKATEQEKLGHPRAAAEAYQNNWTALARCAKQGSTEALLGLASSAYFGWGTERNAETAHWFLRRAETREAYDADGALQRPYGMERSACLWLGDFYYAGWTGEPDLNAADAAYRYAASVSVAEAEAAWPPHVLKERWQIRVDYLRRVRAEALYRLAILRAVGFENDRAEQRAEAFSFLCAAILAGHDRAKDDLARMYDYETHRVAAETKESHGRLLSSKRGEEKHAVQTYDYLAWMTAYYAACRPTLQPFAMEPVFMPHPQVPAYMAAPVTPVMRAAALNHLGDLFFEGKVLREDRTAAVTCFREAADTVQPRGEAASEGIVWANYSLGWCLLHGEGVSKDPREGVRRLTRAAGHHPEAAYTLGVCYETGVGVDAESLREAVKYYRKAKALGHRRAPHRLKILEAQL